MESASRGLACRRACRFWRPGFSPRLVAVVLGPAGSAWCVLGWQACFLAPKGCRGLGVPLRKEGKRGGGGCVLVVATAGLLGWLSVRLWF